MEIQLVISSERLVLVIPFDGPYFQCFQHKHIQYYITILLVVCYKKGTDKDSQYRMIHKHITRQTAFC